jgi:hypothetical protein
MTPATRLTSQSLHLPVDRAELFNRAADPINFAKPLVERQPLSLEERIAAALDALDGLSDAADTACRFSLKAIAGHAYAALDGYVREREAA